MARSQDAPMLADPVSASEKSQNPERRNIVFHVTATFFFKFGLEAFVGSYQALAANRYDADSDGTVTFQRIGLLTGLFQAFQCVGAILIGPLIQRHPSRLVLCCTSFFFSLLVAILLIIDAATGGTIKPRDWETINAADDFSYYGKFSTDCMIPIIALAGMAYGMIDQTRRVVPRDIVGGHLMKLRRLDAFVHIIYEVAGTGGAWCTGLLLIPALGNNMSFIITPICMTIASFCWYWLDNLGFVKQHDDKYKDKTGLAYFAYTVMHSFWLFLNSFWTGAKIIFSSRDFFWLVPSCSIGMYAHRLLENSIAPILAKRSLGRSAWAQIMVGGSNLGELFGALFVVIFTSAIQTPIPWLRIDALSLLILWFLPFWHPQQGKVVEAWKVAASFVPISFGWAASDVSTSAHIQAHLSHRGDRDVSESFIYTSYIVLYAVASPLLGTYVDSVSNASHNISKALLNIVGIQFTVLAGLILLGTFIPSGSFAWNPKLPEIVSDETHDANDSSGYMREGNDPLENTSPCLEMGKTDATLPNSGRRALQEV